LWSLSEQKNAKIRPPLGITTKSVFVFTQARPIAVAGKKDSALQQRVVDTRNGRYGIAMAGHSALMPANLIILAHFSVSWSTSLPLQDGPH
jgi:hypothetical protein